MGICSASGTKRIDGWLQKKNLASIITTYVSRDDKRQFGLKPNPRPLLAAVLKVKRENKLGKIDKNRVIYVGDNTWDIRTAKNAGVKSIAVLSGNGSRSELKLSHPDYMISGVAQIPSLLPNLFQTLP